LRDTPLVLSVSRWQSVAFETWKPKVIHSHFLRFLTPSLGLLYYLALHLGLHLHTSLIALF
jgi:hypothetical protein